MLHRVIFVLEGGKHASYAEYRDFAETLRDVLNRASTDAETIEASIADTLQEGLQRFGNISDGWQTLVFVSAGSDNMERARQVMGEYLGTICTVVLTGDPLVATGTDESGVHTVHKSDLLRSEGIVVSALLPKFTRTT